MSTVRLGGIPGSGLPPATAAVPNKAANRPRYFFFMFIPLMESSRRRADFPRPADQAPDDTFNEKGLGATPRRITIGVIHGNRGLPMNGFHRLARTFAHAVLLGLLGVPR